MAGAVDFSAANAKSNAQLRVKGQTVFLYSSSFSKPNDCKPLLSCSFLLLKKLRIVTPIRDTEVKEGSEIVFNCETNTEGAKAKWLKNEETIFESSKYMMMQRDNVFSLRIKDAQKADEAAYTVSLTNHRGEHAKCSASAKVSAEKLRFMEPIEDIETQEKKTISFVCKVNRPEVTVKWMKAGEEVTFSKRIVYRADGLKHTLTIKDCVMEDEGEYTNETGNKISSKNLQSPLQQFLRSRPPTRTW
uniref:Ig-like domain-containing protein n=1 Tax=Cyprinodon variegatus TaxID=28743 RepID=A0A3Q2DIK7_CYPVA